MIFRLLLAAITLGICSCNSNDKKPMDQDPGQLEKELTSAIEERFYTWKNNDYEAHMATYHPDWRRCGVIIL